MTYRFFTKIVLVIVLAGCGGGGGGGLGPFYIQTDTIVVDIDNNGRPDILVLASLSYSYTTKEGHLVIYRQLTPGIFGPPETYVVGTYPWQFTTEDVDGDGARDIAIADIDDDSIYLMYQDPLNPGEFLSPAKLPGTVGGFSVVLADLNNDGYIDIAGADTVTDQIVIHYQDPGNVGTFQVSYYPLGAQAAYLATGDLNADGLVDILSGASQEGLAYILQGPNGQLGQAVYVAPQTVRNLRELAIADYDGDGYNDILAYYMSGISPDHLIRVLLQYSTVPGTFMPPVDTSLTGIRGLEGIVFEDLDSDQLPDAATVGLTQLQCPIGGGSCNIESRVNLLLQSGGGTFYLAQSYNVSLNISRITAGDLNLDGANDLVLFGVDTNGGGDLLVAVLYQSATTPGTFDAPVIISP